MKSLNHAKESRSSRKSWRAASVLLLSLAALPCWADLEQVRNEPDLEKRAELALLAADAAITRSRQDWEAGKADEFKTSLTEVEEAVTLAYDSLQDTGKDPARRPKHFKRAELRLRTLLRRLTGLQADVDEQDRPTVERVRTKTMEIQEQLLLGVMRKKR